MNNETYLQTVDVLENAISMLMERLEEFQHETRQLSNELLAGVSLHEAMTPTLWATRDRVEAAWLEFQHALHRARAEGVALVIDEGGYSLTEFARKRGLSRQLISRLYNEAHAATTSVSDAPVVATGFTHSNTAPRQPDG